MPRAGRGNGMKKITRPPAKNHGNPPKTASIDPDRIRRNLLDWFDRKKRAMPWRAKRTAYRTVVSEFMLQQTQVATVIPYFERFVEQFPNFLSLARAPEAEVLRAWSGLGYYRRARLLHAAAKSIVEEHAGRLPKSVEELRELPGLGAYTVAAVGSIALGLPLAAVDGNVRRVLSRLFTIPSSIPLSGMDSYAEKLLDARRPGDWNEAMMELGATICRPNVPVCSDCPVSGQCRAFAKGKVNQYPRVKAGIASVTVREIAVAAFRGKRFLLVRRPADSSFGGMWEFPRWDGGRKSAVAERSPEEVLGALTGLRAIKAVRVGGSRSTFTHHKVVTELYRVGVAGKGNVHLTDHEAHAWVTPEEAREFAMGSAQKRLLALLAR